MKRIPFKKFGEIRMVPLKTWTDGKQDKPAKEKFDTTLWIERGEDWYALMSDSLRKKTVLVVDRDDWLESPAEGMKRDIKTCGACGHHSDKVEAGGMWYCPNLICLGCGAAWFRSKCESFKAENSTTHTVSPAEWLYRAELYMETDEAKKHGNVMIYTHRFQNMLAEAYKIELRRSEEGELKMSSTEIAPHTRDAKKPDDE